MRFFTVRFSDEGPTLDRGMEVIINPENFGPKAFLSDKLLKNIPVNRDVEIFQDENDQSLWIEDGFISAANPSILVDLNLYNDASIFIHIKLRPEYDSVYHVITTTETQKPIVQAFDSEDESIRKHKSYIYRLSPRGVLRVENDSDCYILTLVKEQLIVRNIAVLIPNDALACA